MWRGSCALVILGLALAACQPPALSITPAPMTIALQLFTTEVTAPLVNELANAYQAENPGLRFAFRLTTTSYPNLLAMVGSSQAETTRFGITHHWSEDSPLWAAPIAQDLIVLIVHPDNPVTDLSLADIQAIFQGRIVNWAAVGGEPATITVISREPGSATRLAFSRTALGDRRITLNARLATSSNAVLQIVQDDPWAIGYVSLGLLSGNVHLLRVEGAEPRLDQPGTYPLVATVYVVGADDPQGADRAFFAWMQSSRGQALIAHRYLPLSD